MKVGVGWRDVAILERVGERGKGRDKRRRRRGEGRRLGCVRAVERRMRRDSRPFTRWVILCRR